MNTAVSPEPAATGPNRVSTVAVALVVVMVAFTVLAAWGSRKLVVTAEQRSLQAQASNASAYVQGTLAPADAPTVLVASEVAFGGGGVATFTHAAGTVIGGSPVPLTLSLMRSSGAVVAAGGPPANVDPGAARSAAAQGGSVLSAVRGLDGVLHLCATTRVSAASGLVVQVVYPPLAQLAAPSLLPEVALHLYAGTRADPARLLLAHGSPVARRQAQRQVTFQGLDLLVVVEPARQSDSALTRDLPWLVLGVGLALSAGVLVIAELFRRGRRRALRLLDMRTVELHDLAHHDELTGLANRRLLWRGLEEMLAEPDGGLAVVCIDIDHFKQLNDRYGHAAGDRVLKAVADRVTAAVRKDDLVARFGGDEFVAVCSHVDSSDMARALADRIRRLVSEPLDVGDDVVTPSVSVGIHLTRADEFIADCFRQADQALYRAKTQRPVPQIR